MTRKELLAAQGNIFSKDLYAAMVIYRSPVTGKLEERHVYADANSEVILWLDDATKFYKEHNISFVSYLNNRIRDEFNFEITEEDCYGE